MVDHYKPIFVDLILALSFRFADVPSPFVNADVEEFYKQCDPERENLCLYGTWSRVRPIPALKALHRFSFDTQRLCDRRVFRQLDR